jgi:hypothetical protein
MQKANTKVQEKKEDSIKEEAIIKRQIIQGDSRQRDWRNRSVKLGKGGDKANPQD